jgi:transcriptional regulator with XRE-family HTH domain
MKKRDLDTLYLAFGNLVRLSREQRPDLTQEKLGRLVGLSRTSITNIEKGRQHIALHQLYVLAEALRVRPEALLPSAPDGAASPWLAEKLPSGTEREITKWAEKLVGDLDAKLEKS